MKRLLILALVTVPLFGGYAYKATVNFSGATTSTQTNITLLFSFSDVKLKTVANSGQIQSTVTRNTYTVPADFVFTDDSSCATLTGSYAWGFDGDYSATAGTGHGWVMIPSYTTSGVTPTVCIGNAAVTTWQGGASPFDTATKAAYHLPDATTLSAVDFTGNANNGTITAATATTGQIDGAAAFNGSTADILLTQSVGLPIYSSSGYSIEFWAKLNASTSCSAIKSVLAEGSGTSGQTDLDFRCPTTANNKMGVLLRSQTATGLNVVTTTTDVFDNTWKHVVWTDTNGTARVYINGAADASNFNYTPSGVWTGAFDSIGSIYRAGGIVQPFNGLIDEVRFVASARSANWIATEYANQNSPPAIGAFSSLSSPASMLPVVY